MKSNTSPRISIGSRKPRKLTLFVDRSLGRQIAEGLSRFGYEVKHMKDVFQDDGQHEDDEDWIAYAAQRGWIILTQDAQIWQKERERRAIEENGAKVFCLHRQDLKRAEKGLMIGRHLLNILRRGRKPTPCFWRLSPNQPIKDLR